MGGLVEAVARPRSRRDFLRLALIGGLVALIAEAGTAAVAWLLGQRVPVFGSRLSVGRIGEYHEANTPARIVAGKLYLVRLPEGLVALYWRCRHLGCDVPWHGSERFTLPTGQAVTGVFHCPCHNSIYTRDGEVVAGPATGPLDIFALEIDDEGRITVDTGAIWRRPVASAADLTPARPGAVGPADRDRLAPVGAGL